MSPEDGPETDISMMNPIGRGLLAFSASNQNDTVSWSNLAQPCWLIACSASLVRYRRQLLNVCSRYDFIRHALTRLLFSDSLVVGNGRVGATHFGNASRDIIVINEDSVSLLDL
jgi:hypothetical protein